MKTSKKFSTNIPTPQRMVRDGNDAEVAMRLRSWIVKVHVTLEIACDELGLHKTALARYLRAGSSPGGSFLRKFLDAGGSVNWLLTGIGSPFSVDDKGVMLREKYGDFVPLVDEDYLGDA